MPKRKSPELKEGLAAENEYREVSGASRCRVGGKKRSAGIAVTYRRQTLEEERKMEAAIGILLAEIVRQKLSCVEKS